ncbi:MAG: gliding motility-associated ABC transporter ATP-binding subunit GldA [Cyclobacteriaceae bacterium]|nr:gliding motility-associated ABC transporter ATP-binding subunit GldA [Cyclobacteriaceae bacterium]
MSLAIKNLTKVFGQQKAVDSISFSVSPGEIVGFLGPNGAGKSTTMKIATGYLPPDSGSVEICGIDVAESPTKIKGLIGYLPEHNPLYLDMYVTEYLIFAGRLNGIKGPELKQRILDIIHLCGLSDEQHKKLESLSKGYRQRVGLAQALIHEPPVLILDEPTSGLDPNQILEIRKVIRDISHNKTVLFSSHIMQEVEALCDRVVVINKGKIVADDQLSRLLQNRTGIVLIVEFKEEAPLSQLREIEGVSEIVRLSANKCKILSQPGLDIRAALFRFAADTNLSLVELKMEEYSMEVIFKELTGAESKL